jgi:hypothetical protein
MLMHVPERSSAASETFELLGGIPESGRASSFTDPSSLEPVVEHLVNGR